MNDDIEKRFREAMTDAPETFATNSAPGEEEFEQMVTDALEQYQDYLFGQGQYYGPAVDSALRGGIRAALADERLSPATLHGQFGEPDFGQEPPDDEDLREAIEESTAGERREMWRRAGQV